MPPAFVPNARNPDATVLTPAQKKEQAAQLVVYEKRISNVLGRAGNMANPQSGFTPNFFRELSKRTGKQA